MSFHAGVDVCGLSGSWVLVLVVFGDVFPVPALCCLQGPGGASYLQLALVTVTPAVNY